MSDFVIKLMAAVAMAALFSVAAIWGWNVLFGEFKTFSFDLRTIAAVMAISFVFTGAVK